MKKTFLAVLTALSLGLTAFVPASIAQSARALAPDFADLVEKASPAVVNIRTTEQRASPQQGNHAKQSVVLARVSLLSPMAWF